MEKKTRKPTYADLEKQLARCQDSLTYVKTHNAQIAHLLAVERNDNAQQLAAKQQLIDTYRKRITVLERLVNDIYSRTLLERITNKRLPL